MANSLFQRITILAGRSMLYRTERQSADTVKSAARLCREVLRALFTLDRCSQVVCTSI